MQISFLIFFVFATQEDEEEEQTIENQYAVSLHSEDFQLWHDKE